MTGEMHSSELTKDGEWGPMVRLAEALGGEIRPFDQYQGPYIAFEDELGGKHELWLWDSNAVIYDATTGKGIHVGYDWCYLDDNEAINEAANTIKSILEDDFTPSP